MTPPAHAPAAVTLLRVALPLRTPLRSAHGTEEVRHLVLVRMELADGSVGWGECSALERPTYTSEWSAGAWSVLHDQLVPEVLAGEEPDVVGHPMAFAALTTARLDADLRRRGVALAAELGQAHGRPAPAVARGAVIGRGGPDDVLAAVEARIHDGASLVKLKVTPAPDDLDNVARVRAAWPDLVLAVDANGTLDARAASLLAEHDLAYVEQPRPPDDLLGSAELARRFGLRVALDESVTSVDALRSALALGAAQVVNVKPARLGGVRPAAEVARVAADAGCGVFVGGMLESGIGRAAALALAALPICDVPTDLGPSAQYLARDVTDPIELDADGRVVVPVGPGIGVVPRADRLDAFVHDRSTLTA